MNNSNIIYRKRKVTYENDLVQFIKKDNTFVLLRRLITLAVIGLLLLGYFKEIPYSPVYIGLLVVLFLILVNKHQQIRKQITYLQNLIRINEHSLLRLDGKWTGFINTGEQFINPDHPYSSDLTIFGQGSLYQYINATTFFMGEDALARLLSEETSLEQIAPRQKAIEDLDTRLDWRQHFQAKGMSSTEQRDKIAGLLKWAGEKPLSQDNKYLYLIWLLIITTALLFVLMAYRLVPTYIPLIPLVIQSILVTLSLKVTYPVFRDTEKAASELERFASLLNHIEQEKFQSPLLTQLQKHLQADGQMASQGIKDLSKIAAIINLRYSVIYLFINALFFCDLYTIRKLDRWKVRYGMFMEKWFRVLGEFEALSSLAVLAHDNPDWIFPEISSGQPNFTAVSLGHPLIAQESRVCNDVSLPAPGTIFVITGSNMSGKSTLLRTAGINLVLAYAGAPVCARSMRCSLMKLYTSMQAKDNLEQNTSTFYAELKRIKMVIDAAQHGKPVIFMLDEVFRGTNSHDRIIGAKTVIKNLSDLSAVGFVTTHDLELATLEKEYPHIKNFHFTDRIIDNKITFDYRLKEGVSKTTNAIALMKMIGIQI